MAPRTSVRYHAKSSPPRDWTVVPGTSPAAWAASRSESTEGPALTTGGTPCV